MAAAARAVRATAKRVKGAAGRVNGQMALRSPVGATSAIGPRARSGPAAACVRPPSPALGDGGAASGRLARQRAGGGPRADAGSTVRGPRASPGARSELRTTQASLVSAPASLAFRPARLRLRAWLRHKRAALRTAACCVHARPHLAAVAPDAPPLPSTLCQLARAAACKPCLRCSAPLQAPIGARRLSAWRSRRSNISSTARQTGCALSAKTPRSPAWLRAADGARAPARRRRTRTRTLFATR
jgi:hypothetical protein